MRSERIPARLIIFFLLFLVFLFAFSAAASAQVPFQTVLGPGTASWEIDGVGHPFILKENGTYRMWYTGNRFWWEGRWWSNDASIGYAESTDGINWTNRQQVHTNGNLLTDYLLTSSPWVIKEDSTYRMWHSDYYVWVGGDWSWYVSHLTSTNGINWSNEQEVLRGSGNLSDNDDYNTGNQSVIREAAGTYSMWYQVHQRPSVGVGGPSNIVRATSTDGISWTNRWVVLPRIPGTPEASVGSPDVVRNADGTYTMYYAAGGGIHWASGDAIYRAQSTNGIIWTNRQQILSRSQLASDILTLDHPHYFRNTDDGTEYLYFSFSKSVSGSTAGYNREYYIGRALLKDLVPPAPTELTATAKSAYRIDLSWKAPTPKTGLVGYKIERSPDGLTNWQAIGDIPSIDTTSYSNTALSASTTYHYRIRSYNSIGNTSDPSNVANATTYKVESVSTGGVPVDLGNGISLTFSNVTGSGTATVEVPDAPPQPDFGFSVSKVLYFDIKTDPTNIYSGPILVALPYGELKNPTNPTLWHYEYDSKSGKWKPKDVTLKPPDSDFPQITVNPDTANKIIYGKVTSLSPFAIVEPAPPTGLNTYWLLIFAISLMIGGWHLLLRGKRRLV